MSDNVPYGQPLPGQPEPVQPEPVQPPQPPVRQVAGGLAIAALIVGIAAFVIGWIPVVGAVVGIGGIILSIIALQKPRGRALSVTGLILSSIAIIVNLILTVALVVTLVSAGSWQSVDTACYTFDGPKTYILNTSQAELDACATQLELWGERDADGEIHNTGVGAILGSVNVEPVSVTTSDELAPDGTLDSMVDALSQEYIPALGEVISLRESVTLDGVDANLTRVTSDAERTKTKALLTVFAPDTFDTVNGAVQFFVISFVIPEDNGDEIIDALIDRWRWK